MVAGKNPGLGDPIGGVTPSDGNDPRKRMHFRRYLAATRSPRRLTHAAPNWMFRVGH